MLNLLTELLDPPCWVLEWKGEALFGNAIRCLDRLSPDGFLVLEREKGSSDVDSVLEALSEYVYTCPIPDTASRAEAILVIPWTAHARETILELTQSHAAPEICEHLVFSGRNLRSLLLWYDVGPSPIIIRPCLPEATVSQVAEVAGCTYHFDS